MAHDGSDSLVVVASTLLEGVLTQSYDNTTDEIEKTTKDSNKSKEFMSGEDSGTGSIEGRLDSTATYGYEQLDIARKAGSAVTIIIGLGNKTAGGEIHTFSSIITGLSRTDPENGTINWTMNFRRTGADSYGTSATTYA